MSAEPKGNGNVVAWIALVVSVGSVLLQLFLGTYVQPNLARAPAAQLCLNWATFVEDEHRRGVSTREIDRRGSWVSQAILTSDSTFQHSLPKDCGTAEGILYGKGQPPRSDGG